MYCCIEARKTGQPGHEHIFIFFNTEGCTEEISLMCSQPINLETISTEQMELIREHFSSPHWHLDNTYLVQDAAIQMINSLLPESEADPLLWLPEGSEAVAPGLYKYKNNYIIRELKWTHVSKNKQILLFIKGGQITKKDVSADSLVSFNTATGWKARVRKYLTTKPKRKA